MTGANTAHLTSKRELTIGEFSARSGVASSALRFYEERRLLHSVRTAAGHRRYPRAALRRVAFIVFAQRIGLSLDDIARELGKLPKNDVPTTVHWERLSARWVKQIDARMAELGNLRESLTACIGCGCLSLDKCRLSNPGDSAKKLGPGPARWNATQARGRKLPSW